MRVPRVQEWVVERRNVVVNTSCLVSLYYPEPRTRVEVSHVRSPRSARVVLERGASFGRGPQMAAARAAKSGRGAGGAEGEGMRRAMTLLRRVTRTSSPSSTQARIFRKWCWNVADRDDLHVKGFDAREGGVKGKRSGEWRGDGTYGSHGTNGAYAVGRWREAEEWGHRKALRFSMPARRLAWGGARADYLRGRFDGKILGRRACFFEGGVSPRARLRGSFPLRTPLTSLTRQNGAEGR